MNPANRPWYKKYWPIIVVVLLAIGLFLLIQNKSTQEQLDSSVAYTAPDDSSAQDSLKPSSVNAERLKQLITANSDTPTDTSALASQINAILNNNQDITFGVSIIDLNDGATHHYGSQEPMTAASTTKVLTAVDYMKQVELGQKSLDTVMANGYSAQYNIEQMIVVSNNDAWHVLNDSLGYSQLQEYANSIGLSTYSYVDNTINSSDMSKLLGDMYERRLINEMHTELLLSYMERANYRDLVIPAVPDYDTVYHKAGELYSNLHDATIITNSSKAIVLTIFTESHSSYNKARVSSLMQQITTPTLQTFQLN